MKKSLLAIALPMLLAGQVKPPVDSWPTYNGDYSGQRFSPLKQINQLNVRALTLAWVYHPSGGQTPGSKRGSTSRFRRASLSETRSLPSWLTRWA